MKKKTVFAVASIKESFKRYQENFTFSILRNLRFEGFSLPFSKKRRIFSVRSVSTFFILKNTSDHFNRDFTSFYNFSFLKPGSTGVKFFDHRPWENIFVRSDSFAFDFELTDWISIFGPKSFVFQNMTA